MNARWTRLAFAAAAAAAMALCMTTGGGVLNPDDPVTISVWNYYNGNSKTTFDSLVNRFNSTRGKDLGVTVDVYSTGDVDALNDAVSKAADEANQPDLVSIYTDQVYELEQRDLLVNLDDFFTKAELEEYVPGFIAEGRVGKDGALLNFPVSKSTEVFEYNMTDWAQFEAATGVSIEQAGTMEGLAAAAAKYYEWTDSRTPGIREDGKALFGRDSLSNYMLLGAYRLGHPVFSQVNGKLKVDVDRGTMRTLWNDYYIPFINGYFCADSKYRSDDAKVGKILAMVGSSAGAAYFPTAVTDENDQSYSIQCGILPPPGFENQVNEAVVQQGAGYSVLKSDKQRESAAVEFLKWLTDTQQNLRFALNTSYMPVKMEALNEDLLSEKAQDLSSDGRNIQSSLLLSANLFLNKETFYSTIFDGSSDARTALGSAIENAAKNDRAAVERKIASGMSREEAVADFSTDSHFDSWYADLVSTIRGIVPAE